MHLSPPESWVLLYCRDHVDCKAQLICFDRGIPVVLDPVYIRSRRGIRVDLLQALRDAGLCVTTRIIAHVWEPQNEENRGGVRFGNGARNIAMGPRIRPPDRLACELRPCWSGWRCRSSQRHVTSASLSRLDYGHDRGPAASWTMAGLRGECRGGGFGVAAVALRDQENLGSPQAHPGRHGHTAEVLRPWHVYFWRHPARERYLHAVTSVEALAQCKKLLGFDRYQLNIEACDDIQVLWTLSDRELEWQCRYLWRGRGPATEFGQRVPGLQRRWSSSRLGVNTLTPPMRQLAIYAIRLAQEVEAVGPNEDWRGARARAIAQQKRKNSTVPYRGTSHRARQAYERHGSNVSDAVIQACLDAGLRVPVKPYTPAIVEALTNLALAYGYDMKTMTLGLMMLLWAKGPAAIDDE